MKSIRKFIEKVGMDKVAHFLACVLVTLVVAIVFEKTTVGLSSFAYAFMGAFAAIVVGIIKEVVDFLSGERFDTHDLLADIIGAVAGFILAAVLILL